jgi:hypothetical protein
LLTLAIGRFSYSSLPKSTAPLLLSLAIAATAVISDIGVLEATNLGSKILGVAGFTDAKVLFSDTEWPGKFSIVLNTAETSESWPDRGKYAKTAKNAES